MAAERAQPANVGILAVEVYFPSNCVSEKQAPSAKAAAPARPPAIRPPAARTKAAAEKP
jgi:hypothetical protein